jgi:outer membrane lipoprotein-sorting protein
MKKIFMLLAAFIVVAAQAQTADEVINKYLSAAGGKEKLESIRSLQYIQTMNLNTPMGPMQITLTQIRVKDKLLRFNTTSELFGTAYMVVTDTSGWAKVTASEFTEGKDVVEKLKPEQVKAFKTQMNCEGFFPELVNYASKGFTAELAGESKVNGRLSYKVKLKNKQMEDNKEKIKGELLYYIDKETGLINSVVYKGSAAAAMTGMGGGMKDAGKMEKFEITCNFSDYKEISGVKFPGKMKMEMPMGTIESTIGFVTVNPTIDAKMYRAE